MEEQNRKMRRAEEAAEESETRDVRAKCGALFKAPTCFFGFLCLFVFCISICLQMYLFGKYLTD